MTTKNEAVVKGPAKEPYLKGRNAVYLWGFVAVNVAVFLSLVATRHFDGSSIARSWTLVATKNGIIAAGIPLVAIVFSGLLSDMAKARLVFWRWQYPLPGCRIFSALVSTDPRIDQVALKKMIGEFPVAPQEQNALWYKLYKKHKGNRMVWESHKIYLLTRDMTSMSAPLALLFSLGVAISGTDGRTLLIYTALLAAQYVLTAKAAHNYGNRFALNVICEEASQVMKASLRPAKAGKKREPPEEAQA